MKVPIVVPIGTFVSEAANLGVETRRPKKIETSTLL